MTAGITTGIDWEAVKAELASEAWEEEDFFWETPYRQVFIGSVFTLMPSGKYYTPWAHGNIEPCDACARAMDMPCDEAYPCGPVMETGFRLDSEGFQQVTEYEGPPGAPYHCEPCADAMMWQALETEAEAHGLWLTAGEGCPTDIMAGQTRE